MPLTRSFRETVRERAQRSPALMAALVEEAKRALAEGDTETARTLFRHAAKATRLPLNSPS